MTSEVVEDRLLVTPVLPLRDVVVYPHMVIPLFVGRDRSIRALEAAMEDKKQILLVAQKNAAVDDPQPEDVYRVGTLSSILQLLKLPDGTVKVLVEGNVRARIVHFVGAEDYFTAQVATSGEISALCSPERALRSMTNPVSPSAGTGSTSTELTRARGGSSSLKRRVNRSSASGRPSTSMKTPLGSLPTCPA